MEKNNETAETRPRIAVVHPEYTCRGGAERKSLVYAGALRDEFDVTILCGNLDRNATFSEYLGDTPIVSFPFSGPVSKLRSLIRLGRALTSYDVIIANNHPIQFAAGIAAWFFHKPVIWFCNEPALYLPGTRGGGFKKWVLRGLERVAVRHFHTVVANSQHTAANIKSAMQLAPVVIYSGIDFSRYPTTSPARKKRDVFQLILVSRLEVHKQIDRLFSILDIVQEQVDNVQLTIVGTGSDAGRLQTVAGQRPVIFVDNADEEEKIRLLSEADVFVFPTENEPLGVTPIEAQACGCPVVAFNNGGVRETVDDEHTGFLVDTDQAFAYSVFRLLKDSELRQTVGQAGVLRARELFSQGNMVSELRALIYDVLS